MLRLLYWLFLLLLMPNEPVTSQPQTKCDRCRLSAAHCKNDCPAAAPKCLSNCEQVNNCSAACGSNATRRPVSEIHGLEAEVNITCTTYTNGTQLCEVVATATGSVPDRGDDKNTTNASSVSNSWIIISIVCGTCGILTLIMVVFIVWLYTTPKRSKRKMSSYEAKLKRHRFYDSENKRYFNLVARRDPFYATLASVTSSQVYGRRASESSIMTGRQASASIIKTGRQASESIINTGREASESNIETRRQVSEWSIKTGGQQASESSIKTGGQASESSINTGRQASESNIKTGCLQEPTSDSRILTAKSVSTRSDDTTRTARLGKGEDETSTAGEIINLAESESATDWEATVAVALEALSPARGGSLTVVELDASQDTESDTRLTLQPLAVTEEQKLETK